MVLLVTFFGFQFSSYFSGRVLFSAFLTLFLQWFYCGSCCLYFHHFMYTAGFFVSRPNKNLIVFRHRENVSLPSVFSLCVRFVCEQDTDNSPYLSDMTTFFSGIFFDNFSCEPGTKDFSFSRTRFNLNFQRGEHNWLVSFSLPTNADRLHLCKLIDSDKKYLICYVLCYEDNSCWEKTDSLLPSFMPRLPFMNYASDFFSELF